jgi:pyrimidine operon attenuation protein/uracil phosphoribosyltransferase
LKTVLNEQQLDITIKRLSHQILENHPHLENTVIVGIQPRGVFVSDSIVEELRKILPHDKVKYGILDITFYRDDIRKEIHMPNQTKIPFTIEQERCADR